MPDRHCGMPVRERNSRDVGAGGQPAGTDAAPAPRRPRPASRRSPYVCIAFAEDCQPHHPTPIAAAGQCLNTNHDERDQSRPRSRGRGASASDESSRRVRLRRDCAAVGQGRPCDRGEGMPDPDSHLNGDWERRPGTRTELSTNPAAVETERAIAHVTRRGRLAIHLSDARDGMHRLRHRVRRHRHLADGQGDDHQGTKPKSAECTRHAQDTRRNSLRRQPRSHRRNA